MDNNWYENKVKNIDKDLSFKLIKTQLYKIRDDKIVKVIRKFEVAGILYMLHDHELSAHFGIKATQEKVQEKYWWKGMSEDIENYVKSCDKCQRRNRPHGKNELNPISVKTPFYQIGIDFVGPLPMTRRKNQYIIASANLKSAEQL